jgi:hypothetical protein
MQRCTHLAACRCACRCGCSAVLRMDPPAARSHHADKVRSACPAMPQPAAANVWSVLTRAAIRSCAAVWSRVVYLSQDFCRAPGCSKRIEGRIGERHHLCAEHRSERLLPYHPPPLPSSASSHSPPPPLFDRPQGCLDQLTLLRGCVEKASACT